MKAKIYIIRSKQTDNVYYGCTIQTLSSRFSNHKADYKQWLNNNEYKHRYTSSFEIIKHGDAYIELVEEFEYEIKEQLKEREGYWIRNNPCINKLISGRTLKEWYEENKNNVSQKMKKYYEKNREIILQKVKDRKSKRK